MKVLSPPGLAYPITVLEIHKARNEPVTRSDRLFTYSYESVVTEGDRWGNEKTVRKRFPTRFEASAEGIITRWEVRPGSVIERPGADLLEIEEPCTHETQFGGLCADCGKDMTEVDYLTKERNIERATVNMTHDNVALLISHKEAVRAEEDTQKRLLGGRKLTLIVDLDQTVIHTTCERTVSEWQADPKNPNHEAAKDVQSFQLADDNVSNVAANWYYVKMRPGLRGFFDRLSTLYEMHVYTMATRAYAQAVAKIIDPDRKYFGDRILSRDENYTDKLKSLARLFYQNTAMVVIIDDRADVWQYSPHLVRVPVFNFFPGAGDINASFLPKQQELITNSSGKHLPALSSCKPEIETVHESTQSSNKQLEEIDATDASLSPLAETAVHKFELQFRSIGAPKDADLLEQQAKEQEKIIIAQQTEQPLRQRQLMLDKEDDEAEDIDVVSMSDEGRPEHIEHYKVRHGILNNNDDGLDIVEKNLVCVHKAFYDEYMKVNAGPAGGRVAQLKGQISPKKRLLSESIPNVAEIMPRIKQNVLKGVVVVFSGVIPLGIDIHTSDLALWITSFGAEVSTSVNRRTTHVIANPERKTTKVKKAARYTHIKIVTPKWMLQCCTRWERVNETPYLIEVDSAARDGSLFGEDEEDSFNISGDEETEESGESPVTLDLTADTWASVDDELADFLNETDTDGSTESDSESINSTKNSAAEVKSNRAKRKRATSSAEGTETEESDGGMTSTSKLQRRKKRTMERVSSLTNVVMADKSSGLPSPETTGPEEGHEGQGDEDDAELENKDFAPDHQQDYDDGLEAELLAGFDNSDGEG